jgi:hypothetical protein
MKFRLLLLCLLFASAAFGQVSFGVKAGVPINDFLQTRTLPTIQFLADTHHWTVGPTVEFHLPAGLSIEVDALYQRIGYNSATSASILSGTNLIPLVGTLGAASATANAWEFPLLIKYRAGKKTFRPFLDAGASFHSISGFKQLTNLTNPPQLVKNFDGGVVVGGGLDAHFLLHFEPEIRYTRWFTNAFTDPTGSGLSSNRNEFEFLLGVRF